MKREHNMDLLRVASAMAVIIVHVLSAPIAYAGEQNHADLAPLFLTLNSFVSWAVPVFFMLTGYFVSLKKECTYKYCFSHVLKYGGILLTVGLFYALIEEFFTNRTMDFATVWRSLQNVISGNIWSHMWYVYAIIGVYLVLPIFHLFMQQGKKNILILTGLIFFFAIICPEIEHWVKIGIYFPFNHFFFYVCLGGAIAKCDFDRKIKIGVWVLGLASVVWILANYGRYYGNSSLPVSLIAASIFLLVKEIRLKPNKLVSTASQCTWGIYLIHPFFMNIAVKVLKIDFLSTMPYLKLPALFAALFLLSFGSTYLLRKIPLIKNLF